MRVLFSAPETAALRAILGSAYDPSRDDTLLGRVLENQLFRLAFLGLPARYRVVKGTIRTARDR